MQLPQSLEPIRLAKLGAQMQGELQLSTCERLQELCDQKNNQAIVDLQFGQDASRIYFIKGHVKATVNLICQRCNTLMHFDLDISFALSPVTSEARAKNLPEAYEPVFMTDEMVAVYEMIEDEILLALPMVWKHEICNLN